MSEKLVEKLGITEKPRWWWEWTEEPTKKCRGRNHSGPRELPVGCPVVRSRATGKIYCYKCALRNYARQFVHESKDVGMQMRLPFGLYS